MTAIVMLDGMGKIVANVHLPSKEDNAINASVGGTDRHVINVIRAIPVRTVMYVRKGGSQRQIA